MKTRRVFQKTTALLLCAALTALFVLFAQADAWEPPDDAFNYFLVGDPAGSRVVNLAVSNLVESGLTDLNVSDNLIRAAALKHIELNESQYKDVSLHTDSRGQQYMKIKSSKFEEVSKMVFNRDISAKTCAGYNNGYITVTAANANAPIDVFAIHSNWIEYVGNSVYRIDFDIYRLNSGNLSDMYDYYGPAALDDFSNVTYLGSGAATFGCYIGKDATPTTKDIRFLSYSSDYAWNAYNNENDAYVPQETTTRADAPSSAAPSSTAPSSTASQPVATDAGETADPGVLTSATEQTTEEKKEPAPSKTGDSKNTLLLILTVVVAVSAAAIVIVFVIDINKRKQSR